MLGKETVPHYGDIKNASSYSRLLRTLISAESEIQDYQELLPRPTLQNIEKIEYEEEVPHVHVFSLSGITAYEFDVPSWLSRRG